MTSADHPARRRQRVNGALHAAWLDRDLGCVVDELFREVAADVVRRTDGGEGVLSSCSQVSIDAAPEMGALVEVRARVISSDVGHRRLALEARSVPRTSSNRAQAVVASALGTVVLPGVVED
ncbi:hypothetical protein BJ993_002064 [Nocardioides aromaticivorans]|uniref:Thioesterase n=1 Tax=Nocardioides aromaticivorans TaxID=200618 RepID=A0A7Z0CL84_9ACTN|nr:hypothetical protein [Nocardioides aromaticivorans]NYI44984.1 hypothetical protein [Nocardioides aromaticivorans]